MLRNHFLGLRADQNQPCLGITGKGASDAPSAAIPAATAFARVGVELVEFPKIRIFEMCRFLSETSREQVLATAEEQRINIQPELQRILQLDEWHHPDLSSGERPSQSQTFQQLAEVLVTGDPSYYRPSESPNTHWKNWPTGGTL